MFKFELYSRDSEKEQRIRELEARDDSGVSKSTVQAMINAQNTLNIRTKYSTVSYVPSVVDDDLVVYNSPININSLMPTATGSGHIFFFKNIGAGTARLIGAAGNTIDGDLYLDIFTDEGWIVIDSTPGAWVIT